MSKWRSSFRAIQKNYRISKESWRTIVCRRHCSIPSFSPGISKQVMRQCTNDIIPACRQIISWSRVRSAHGLAGCRAPRIPIAVRRRADDSSNVSRCSSACLANGRSRRAAGLKLGRNSFKFTGRSAIKLRCGDLLRRWVAPVIICNILSLHEKIKRNQRRQAASWGKSSGPFYCACFLRNTRSKTVPRPCGKTASSLHRGCHQLMC
jgi:hypothetical protein